MKRPLGGGQRETRPDTLSGCQQTDLFIYITRRAQRSQLGEMLTKHQNELLVNSIHLNACMQHTPRTSHASSSKCLGDTFVYMSCLQTFMFFFSCFFS